MQLTEATTLDRKSGEADLSRRTVEGSAFRAGNPEYYTQTKLSSRPERSVVERSAVFFYFSRRFESPHKSVLDSSRLIFLLISGTLRQQSEWQIGESNASCGYKRA